MNPIVAPIITDANGKLDMAKYAAAVCGAVEGVARPPDLHERRTAEPTPAEVDLAADLAMYDARAWDAAKPIVAQLLKHLPRGYGVTGERRCAYDGAHLDVTYYLFAEVDCRPKFCGIGATWANAAAELLEKVEAHVEAARQTVETTRERYCGADPQSQFSPEERRGDHGYRGHDGALA